MSTVRLLSADRVPTQVPCCRCQAPGLGWDRIVDKPYCPDCEEALAQGEAEPLIERAEPTPCSICGRGGTLRYLTFPLESAMPVEMHLCGRHVRDLLARRLERTAFHHLRRQLAGIRVNVGCIFLLHDAFYDAEGR